MRCVAAAVLAVVLASPAVIHAQAAPSRVPRIGVLSIGTDPSEPLPLQWVAFFEGLRALGYVDAETIRVERGFAGGRAERVTELAKAMVTSKVDVIVVTGTREVAAARQATRTIPIVTVVASDPVESGIASSLSRPGGNITGLTFSAAGIGQKYVELVRQAVPSASRLMVLASRPQAPGLTKDMQETARRLNTTLLPITLITHPDEFETFFARARRDGVGAVIAPSDGVTNLHRAQVVAAAARHGVPTIYSQREFVDAGGLMAYGPSFVDLFRRAPTFVDKILKGAKPGDLPMEQPTKFELVINLKTATALGLAMPPMLLARADAIIQ